MSLRIKYIGIKHSNGKIGLTLFKNQTKKRFYSGENIKNVTQIGLKLLIIQTEYH